MLCGWAGQASIPRRRKCYTLAVMLKQYSDFNNIYKPFVMKNIEYEKPNHIKEDGLVVKWQLIIFIIAFILGNFIGPFLPKIASEMVFKMVDMLFICGTILLAVKLAREGWDLAATGFTILAIGWGIIFAALYFQHVALDMEVRTSAAYFFIPCMILIAYYRPFSWWLKLLTLCCLVPFVVSLLIQKINPHNEKQIILWLVTGFGLFHLTSVIWGIFFYQQYRRQLKESKITRSIE